MPHAPIPLRGRRSRKTPIPLDALVVVRGAGVAPDEPHIQATEFLRRFPDWGRHGLSAYCAAGRETVDDLAADQLRRFAILQVFEVQALRSAGFDVVPKFRNPHVTITFIGDVDEALHRLDSVEAVTMSNHYHEHNLEPE